MKSASEAICLQEVPDEISLSLAISNCPCHCEGCHSEYLWEDCGRDALQVLKAKLNEISEYITCVLFMGGDDDNLCCRQEDIRKLRLSESRPIYKVLWWIE